MNNELRRFHAPKTIRTALSAGSVFILLVAGLLTGSAPASAGRYVGPVDMQAACDWAWPSMGYTAEVQNSRNAYSWKCIGHPGITHGIDVKAWCIHHYGANAYQGIRDSRNPWSWYCQV